MTKEQITSSISRCRLQLSRRNFFNYYFPTLALFFISALFPTIWLYDRIKGFAKPLVIRPSDPAFIAFVSVPLAFGVVVYFFQRRQLALTSVQSSQDSVQLRQMVKEMAGKLCWRMVVDRPDVLIAVTDPPFWSGSWGERITVLFHDDAVWVNSICDPEKRSSLVSCGRNRANVRAIVRKISNFEKKSFVA